MTHSLTQEEQACLLSIAREALEAAVSGQPAQAIDPTTLPSKLCQPGASFVTLTRESMLRGCIGTLEARTSLAEDVGKHAVDAALYDYRFTRVLPHELPEIQIEVSVLSTPKPLAHGDPDEILKLLRPGIDGVVLISGSHRATFLPQVWSKIPDPETFLGMLCEKAGLPADSWRRGQIQVLTYQVESFHETPTQKT